MDPLNLVELDDCQYCPHSVETDVMMFLLFTVFVQVLQFSTFLVVPLMLAQ